jgi:phenylpyruvate tautomerase PptA (4-oxalocrotonate tautomerase family)
MGVGTKIVEIKLTEEEAAQLDAALNNFIDAVLNVAATKNLSPSGIRIFIDELILSGIGFIARKTVEAQQAFAREFL